ncbi:MAG: hypothetical protein QOC97_1676 [Chloroflexota bacterium]|nr:hypothetical protein [Chloroflexota bacterium]
MTDDNLPTDPTEPFVPMAPVEPIESNAIAFGGPVRTSIGRPIAVRAGILAGSAVLVVIGAVAAMGASPTPATGADPSTAPNSTAAPNASKDPETLEPHDPRGPAGAFPGFGFKGGAFGGLGRFGLGGITITAVNGSDVSLKTDDGWTRTITVTDATKITKGGAAIKVGDLAAGDKVRLAQDRAADGTYTVTGIVVVLPTVAGQVSAVDGNTVTVTQPGGTKATIHVSGGTTYQVNGAKGALSDVKVGSFIAAEGTQRSDGSLDATTVHLGFGGRSSVGGPGTPGFPGGHKGPKPNASPAPSGSAG